MVVTSASADASCLFFVVGGVVSVVGAASRTYHRELVRRYNVRHPFAAGVEKPVASTVPHCSRVRRETHLAPKTSSRAGSTALSTAPRGPIWSACV